MPDTMVFSEEELSDTDETDPVMEQSHESAPGPLRFVVEQCYVVNLNDSITQCHVCIDG